jgi:hypothetical protein
LNVNEKGVIDFMLPVEAQEYLGTLFTDNTDAFGDLTKLDLLPSIELPKSSVLKTNNISTYSYECHGFDNIGKK